eukprot:4937188-Pleurochrysis_carterae.AAC.2
MSHPTVVICSTASASLRLPKAKRAARLIDSMEPHELRSYACRLQSRRVSPTFSTESAISAAASCFEASRCMHKRLIRDDGKRA